MIQIIFQRVSLISFSYSFNRNRTQHQRRHPVSQLGLIAGLTLAFALWMAGDGCEALGQPKQPRPVSDRREPDLIRRLEAAMDAGAWAREGLTIAALASELSVPEHRLRKAINRDLGHRNFPSFINTYRIDAARAALADPARRGDTVLQIAYETGFASLGPFNRAFRDRTGMTPTDYKAQASLADS